MALSQMHFEVGFELHLKKPMTGSGLLEIRIQMALAYCAVSISGRVGRSSKVFISA